MKNRNWLIFLLAGLLIVSVGFNFGFSRALISRGIDEEKTADPENGRQAGWRRESVRRRLDLTEEQAEKLEQSREELHERIAPLRKQMFENRRELMEATLHPEIDEEEIARLVGISAELYAEVERLVIEQIVEVRGHLEPEQWERIDRFLRREPVSRRRENQGPREQ